MTTKNLGVSVDPLILKDYQSSANPACADCFPKKRLAMTHLTYYQ